MSAPRKSPGTTVESMKVWFDTEFIEDGTTIDLISIGMVREDGATYYAETDQWIPGKASQWVKDNVIVHLKGDDAIKPRDVIAREIVAFVGWKPEIWAYYADYDWVALCQLFGTMMQLPEGWPMFCRDVKQLCISLGDPDLPKQTSTEHHALTDAVWTKTAWEFLRSYPLRPGVAQQPGEPTAYLCIAESIGRRSLSFEKPVNPIYGYIPLYADLPPLNEVAQMPSVGVLHDIYITMRHARTFITSREKMHPTGVELWDRLFAQVEALLPPPSNQGASK